MQETFCPNCGKKIYGLGKFCGYCGHSLNTQPVSSNQNTKNPTSAPISQTYQPDTPHSHHTTNATQHNHTIGQTTPPHSSLPSFSAEYGKSIHTAFWLSFLPISGIHRFYLGHVGTGFLYLFTHGFVFIGNFIDRFRIATNNIKDSQGRPLSGYTPTIRNLYILINIGVLFLFLILIAGSPKNEENSPAPKEVPQKNTLTTNQTPKPSRATTPINQEISLAEKKEKPAIKEFHIPTPPKVHKAQIAPNAWSEIPTQKGKGYDRWIKKYGVKRIKEINALFPKVAEKASYSKSLDRIHTVDIADSRSTREEIVFHALADNKNRVFISEKDLDSDGPVLSDEEKLKILLPKHEKMCEDLIKANLTHPSTYEKSIWHSVSVTKNNVNHIIIVFTAKNSFNLEIKYKAIFFVNARNQITSKSIEEIN